MTARSVAGFDLPDPFAISRDGFPSRVCLSETETRSVEVIGAGVPQRLSPWAGDLCACVRSRDRAPLEDVAAATTSKVGARPLCE